MVESMARGTHQAFHALAGSQYSSTLHAIIRVKRWQSSVAREPKSARCDPIWEPIVSPCKRNSSAIRSAKGTWDMSRGTLLVVME